MAVAFREPAKRGVLDKLRRVVVAVGLIWQVGVVCNSYAVAPRRVTHWVALVRYLNRAWLC